MFAGEQINVTEDRAVLHVALRRRRASASLVDGIDVVAAGARGARPDGRVRRPGPRAARGAATPASRSRNVVNIGIGGSDLGPVMAYEALKHYSRPRARRFRFVSNVDGTDFAEATRDLDPAETLFIVSSKTFTTLETMTNAQHRARLGAGRARGRRRRSPSTSSPSRRTPRRCREFGIDTDEHVRLLGLGRRPLLDGLRHRPVDDDRDRARAASASCSPASTPWTSTSAPRRSSRTCRC